MSIDVLIVDDDPDLRETIAELLLDEGYAIAQLGSHEAIRETLARERPKLLLLDLTMPGFQADHEIAELREGGLLEDVVALVLSGVDDSAAIARQLGLDGAVPKPFDVDDLLTQVRAVCRKDTRVDAGEPGVRP